MRTRSAVVAALVVLVAVVVWWTTRDGDGDSEDVRPDEVVVPDATGAGDGPTRPQPALPERARVQPAPPAVTEGPEPAGAESTGAADPAKHPLDVPALLKERVLEIKVDGGGTLREAFGHLSGLTGAPIHLDAESVAGFHAHGGLALQVMNVPGETILELMTQLSGIGFVVLPDRVVLHAKGIEWMDGRRTIVIPPINPDPDAPTSITVRGRVLDASGVSVRGAKLMLGHAQVGVTDDSGAFELEVRPKNQMLTAMAPFAQRSTGFHVHGQYGVTLETEMYLGPPAGGVRVRASSTAGELPPKTRMTVMWPDPDSRADISFDGRSMKGRIETKFVDDKGVGVIDVVPPGEVSIRLSAKGHRSLYRMVDVTEGALADVSVALKQLLLDALLRDERITFRFSETPLSDAINYIGNTKKINIVVTPAAWEKLTPGGVSLNVDDDSLENALRALCDAAGDLTYRIKDDIVLIEPRKR